jgi:hypothetical protein
MATVLVILLIVVTDGVLAFITGVLGRARGRPFWLWATIGFFLPIVAIIALLLLPRRR